MNTKRLIEERARKGAPPSKVLLCAYRDCRRVLPGSDGPGVSLSRADSKTVICSDCGVREAFQPALLTTGFLGAR